MYQPTGILYKQDTIVHKFVIDNLVGSVYSRDVIILRVLGKEM